MLYSILDNDFYKFTMQNAVVKLFPYARARYAFINRGEHSFPPGFGEALRMAVDSMAELALSVEEKSFLELHCPFLDPTYRDFLAGFRFDRVIRAGLQVLVPCNKNSGYEYQDHGSHLADILPHSYRPSFCLP